MVTRIFFVLWKRSEVSHHAKGPMAWSVPEAPVSLGLSKGSPVLQAVESNKSMW